MGRFAPLLLGHPLIRHVHAHLANHRVSLLPRLIHNWTRPWLTLLRRGQGITRHWARNSPPAACFALEPRHCSLPRPRKCDRADRAQGDGKRILACRQARRKLDGVDRGCQTARAGHTGGEGAGLPLQ